MFACGSVCVGDPGDWLQSEKERLEEGLWLELRPQKGGKAPLNEDWTDDLKLFMVGIVL